jgi:beta,beta-carotene 9',10'-dioxygenase
MSKVFELGFGKTENEMSVDQLPVRGQIPEWLSGTLIRNGPGTFEVGAQRYRHWFDGLSMLHKFSINNRRVSYANKYLNTKSYRAARENGRISYSEFATDPCRSFFSRVTSVFSPHITDSAKVSIAKMAEHYMALAETPIQVEFDPETLETVGVFNYEDRLVGQMTTVHPQFDYEHNQVFNVVTRYHRISHYNVYCMENGLSPRKIAAVPSNQPAYMHSFGMTQNYIILTEFPLVVNPISLLLWLKPYIENFQWKPNRGTPFWVINRWTGEIVGRYECDPFFAFHHVNAFEMGDELVIDIDAYTDASILKAYYLSQIEDQDQEIPFGKLKRFRLPLKGKRVSYETISDECMELANFDYARYNMRSDYRYVYAASLNAQHRKGFYNQIVKIDIASGDASAWYVPGCYPGEPIFVGRPDRKEEDDGVILSVVLDTQAGNSFLLILDAHTFSEIARAEIPHAILFGYHGAYFPTQTEG